jgi:replicative superfamily II helicase
MKIIYIIFLIIYFVAESKASIENDLIVNQENFMDHYLQEYNRSCKEEALKVDLEYIGKNSTLFTAFTTEIDFLKSVKAKREEYDLTTNDTLKAHLKNYHLELRYYIKMYKDFDYYLYQKSERAKSLTKNDLLLFLQLKNLLRMVTKTYILIDLELMPYIEKDPSSNMYSITVDNNRNFLKVIKSLLPEKIQDKWCSLM